MANTRTNEQWLEDLSGDGVVQQRALADLRDLLLRSVLYFFSRNRGDLARRTPDEIFQLAEDCAQDALIAIMKHLSEFRGDSKFTTWAYKFGINMALMTARRERWRDVSLDQFSTSEDQDPLEWLKPASTSLSPDQSALQSEVGEMIRDIVHRDLTEKQRQVVVLMVFNEVPMDEVVRQLGTNRNAVYKLLHDARRKLKSGLQARGFEIGDTLTLFSTQG